MRAHSVRRRADLSSIARSGHVYQGSADPTILIKSGGKPKSVLVGINEASTFLGFCGHHDAVTFAPLETTSFVATGEQCFLLAYRNLAREFYSKRAQHDSTPIWREGDRGQALSTQLAKQEVISLMQQAVKESLSNLEHHKAIYDAELVAADFGNTDYVVIQLDRSPTIVCGGTISPSHDFDGKQIQDLDKLGVDRFALVSFSLMATEKGGVAVFAWHKEDAIVAQAFVESLLTKPAAAIPDALVRMAYELIENTFASPTWWEGLPEADRNALESRLLNGAHPTLPVAPDGLSDDGRKYVDWRVTGIVRRERTIDV